MECVNAVEDMNFYENRSKKYYVEWFRELFQVNTIIVECIQQYGIVLKNLAKKDYDIVYVSYDSLRVRGFSGMNITYINKPHFETTNTIYSGKFVSEYLNRIMLVDVINCVVHEYAHVKMREVSLRLKVAIAVARIMCQGVLGCVDGQKFVFIPTKWRNFNEPKYVCIAQHP